MPLDDVQYKETQPWQELVRGLLEYFNLALEMYLLYPSEHLQFGRMKESHSDTDFASIYGPECVEHAYFVSIQTVVLILFGTFVGIWCDFWLSCLLYFKIWMGISWIVLRIAFTVDVDW